MARIPDKEEYRRAFAALDFQDRRRILKAVNRGLALEDPREAAMAVATARRQQRYWSRAWLAGPVLSLLVLFSAGWLVYLANAALITLVLGGMSLFWYRRAQRAEALNEEVALGRPSRQDRPSRPNSSHAPSDAKRRRGQPDPNTSRKKLARRKRR